MSFTTSLTTDIGKFPTTQRILSDIITSLTTTSNDTVTNRNCVNIVETKTVSYNTVYTVYIT